MAYLMQDELIASVQPTSNRPIVLDISRLLGRLMHPTPSGIDRIELGYARRLLTQRDRPVGFEARLPGIGLRVCAREGVKDLVEHFEERWRSGILRRSDGAALAARMLSRGRQSTSAGVVTVKLVVAHTHLESLHRRRGRKNNERLCVFVHDTIPSDLPEYARIGGADRHDRRMENALRHADGLIVNSKATSAALEPFRQRTGRRPPCLVSPLGVDLSQGKLTPAGDKTAPPYFICVGTIEPRKNHLLLLHLWRRMAQTMPRDSIPHLVVVGRRGWENENIIDMFDRCEALRGLVTERNDVGDDELAGLIGGSRALLMPSFAEGYGMPVAEALALGVPVIASDISALRETGGIVPDYLDPLDGLGWMRVILDYADKESPMREAQLDRLFKWRAPTWDEHFRRALSFMDSL